MVRPGRRRNTPAVAGAGRGAPRLRRPPVSIICAVDGRRQPEILEPEGMALGDQHRAARSRRNLADVAGPWIGGERAEQIRGECRPPVRQAAIPREVLDQRGDVLGPLPQRRYLDAEHVEPVVQIEPKRLLLDHRLQRRIGRRDDADRRPLLDLAADPVIGALLGEPQQVALLLGRQLADLVEEQGPAGRLFDIAMVAALGAGKGAALMAEQLRPDKPGGERGAIDGDERSAADRRQLMDDARQQILADAGLAGDQDGQVAGGKGFGLLDDVGHGGATPHHAVEMPVGTGRPGWRVTLQRGPYDLGRSRGCQANLV